MFVRQHADRLAALLIFAMLVAAVLVGARTGWPAWTGGVAAWAALTLLWPGMDHRQRRQVWILVGIGVAAFVYAGYGSGQWPWQGVLTTNIALLGMLAGVSFLQLIGLEADEDSPRGVGALWRTVAGVHVFGAVINLSAIFIMADRMGGAKGPGPAQLNALTRGFLVGALWSPFFAATAVATTNAPGASLGVLAMWGVPLTVVLIALASMDLQRNPSVRDDFVGYPMRPSSLWVPTTLAGMVIAGHWIWPDWTTLAIVTLAAPIMTAAVIFARHGLGDGSSRIVRHAMHRLPAMRGELGLFLAAAVFATGLNALIGSSGVWLPMDHVGALEASLILAGMIALCIVGIHAVISITMVAVWLAPLQPDPILMAMVYMQCWAIGLAASPLSGVHLALQGRYGISGARLARGNWAYCAQGYVAAVITLFAIAAWRGI